MFISVCDLFSSKPFQRLKGKTQLFSPSSNDHYRNRMTHSLEVYSICREIVKKKNINVDLDLLDLIALSHDLGHTPFGHVGERTLNDILSGNDNLGGLLPDLKSNKKLQQGFKHNIYSSKLFLRTFNKYEKDDLCAKLVDGILKHTKPYYTDKDGNIIELDYGIGRITKEFPILNENDNYFRDKDPISIEGRIVSIADEIAQRCSDFSDSMISKLIMFDEFQSLLKDDINLNKADYKNSESIIRNYLIDGLDYNKETNHIYYNEKTKEIDNKISEFINGKIQNSYLIRSDDAKNCHIVRQIFKAFYKKPIQLDDSTLVNLYSDIYNMRVSSIRKKCLDKDNNILVIEVAKYVSEVCKNIENGTGIKNDYIVFKCFLANIAYYIANMTDDFAKKKYMKLYNGENE